MAGVSVIYFSPKHKKLIWRGRDGQDPSPAIDAGFKWCPELKSWWTTDVLAAKVLDDEWSEGAQPLLNKIDCRIAASYATTPRYPCPEMPPEAKTYQVAGVAHILKHKSVLLGDDMGLGKTLQALWAAVASKRKTLIIVPASVAHQWCIEILVWLGEVATVHSGQKSSPIDGHLDIVPDSILAHRAKDIAHDYDFVIVDEAHRYKTGEAKRSAALVRVTKAAEYVVLLTGSPQPNRSQELATLVHGVLGFKWAGTRWFLERFCEPKEIWTGRSTETKYVGSTNSRELGWRLRNSCMLRRTKAQVAKEIPKKTVNTVYIDPRKYKGKINAEDGRRVRILMELAEQGCGDDVPAFEDISTVRQEQAECKLPLIIELIKDRFNESPAVIFCHHKASAEGLAEALGCEYIHGSVSKAERTQRIARFLCGETPHLVGTIRAMGTGVDGLQHRSSTAIFAEMDWTPGENWQAEDRLCRFGQTLPVMIYYILVEGTLDHHVHNTVTKKTAGIHGVMGDNTCHTPE